MFFLFQLYLIYSNLILLFFLYSSSFLVKILHWWPVSYSQFTHYIPIFSLSFSYLTASFPFLPSSLQIILIAISFAIVFLERKIKAPLFIIFFPLFNEYVGVFPNSTPTNRFCAVSHRNKSHPPFCYLSPAAIARRKPRDHCFRKRKCQMKTNFGAQCFFVQATRRQCSQAVISF